MVTLTERAAGLGLAVEAERILQARTAAALHCDPQRERLGILAHERQNMLRRALGEADHALMVPPTESRVQATL